MKGINFFTLKQPTYKQGMCELHGDKGLTREASNSPRLVVYLDACEFHIDLCLDKVPLVVIERHRGA